jgi:uncharacterized protein (TIGR00297 family)
VSAALGWIAWRAGTLTPSGAFAACTVGTLILYGSGWRGGAVLAAFFVGSNLVSRLGPGSLPGELDPKSDRRDVWQVYANGGVAALAAVVAAPEIRMWLVTAALAAAAADTWATSVGRRSSTLPRLLGVGRPVTPGSNGGMTPAGSAAALAGALLVAGIGGLLLGNSSVILAGTLIGFAGMAIDSVLGAVLQGRFHCPTCNQPSEWRVHRCGQPTTATGGLKWVNNDLVNFLATGFAATAAVFTWRWLD